MVRRNNSITPKFLKLAAQQKIFSRHFHPQHKTANAELVESKDVLYVNGSQSIFPSILKYSKSVQNPGLSNHIQYFLQSIIEWIFQDLLLLSIADRNDSVFGKGGLYTICGTFLRNKFYKKLSIMDGKVDAAIRHQLKSVLALSETSYVWKDDKVKYYDSFIVQLFY